MSSYADAPSVPTPTLMQLADERRHIVEMVISTGGEIDDATYEALCEVGARLEAKTEAYLAVIDHVHDRARRAREYAAQCRAYAEACDRLVESIRRRLAAGLQAADVSTVRAGHRTVTVMPGRQSVEITDQSALPLEYIDERVEVVQRPNPNRIRMALEAGRDVPGARLVQGDPYIRVATPRKTTEEE